MLVGLLLQLLTLLVAVLKGVVSLTLLSGQGHAFYATMSQFLVLATFLGSVLSLQLDAATVRFAPDPRFDPARMLSSNLLCVAGVGALLIGLMALVGGSVSPLVFDRAGWRLPMVLAATSSVQTALLLICCAALQARSRFRLLALFQITQYVLQMLAIAWAAGRGSATTVMLAVITTDAAVLLVLLVTLMRSWGLRRPDTQYLRLALPFALPLLVSFFLTWLIHASGRFVLVNVQGLTAVAPYAATFTIAALSGLLTPPFVNVLYPRVAGLQNDPAAAGRLVGRVLGAYLVLSAPLLLLMVMLGQPLVELASGPGFYAGPIVMAGLALGFLATGLTRLAGLLLLTGDKTRQMMNFLAAGVVASVLIVVPGVQPWGANALAVAYGCGFLLPLLLVLRRVGWSRLGLQPARLPGAAVRLGLALAAPACLLLWLQPRHVPAVAGAGLLALLAYGAAAVGVGLIRRDDVHRAVMLVRTRLRLRH